MCNEQHRYCTEYSLLSSSGFPLKSTIKSIEKVSWVLDHLVTVRVTQCQFLYKRVTVETNSAQQRSLIHLSCICSPIQNSETDYILTLYMPWHSLLLVMGSQFVRSAGLVLNHVLCTSLMPR